MGFETRGRLIAGVSRLDLNFVPMGFETQIQYLNFVPMGFETTSLTYTLLVRQKHLNFVPMGFEISWGN